MEIYSGEGLAQQISAWGIPCSFCDLKLAPQLVKYNFTMKNLLQLSKVKKLADTLTALCGIPTQIETAQGGFCIIQPLPERQNLNLCAFMNDLLTSAKYSLVLGQDTDGNKILQTLDDLTHLLVAGTTGGGKSVALNDMILSLIIQNKPEELALVLIDMKQVEFTPYSHIPHLLTDIVSTPERAEIVLKWLIEEMERRYTAMQELGINKNTGQFKKIVVFIDELSDLVLTNENIRPLLIKLLQKSRACGIHFIVATQSPRAKILDGALLSNLPSRMALTCANMRESIIILDKKGAEELTYKGDCILRTPTIHNIRIQIPFVSEKQIKECVL